MTALVDAVVTVATLDEAVALAHRCQPINVALPSGAAAIGCAREGCPGYPCVERRVANLALTSCQLLQQGQEARAEEYHGVARLSDQLLHIRTLHCSRFARVDGDQTQWRLVCGSCRYENGQEVDWPCATAELVYGAEEITQIKEADQQ